MNVFYLQHLLKMFLTSLYWCEGILWYHSFKGHIIQFYIMLNQRSLTQLHSSSLQTDSWYSIISFLADCCCCSVHDSMPWRFMLSKGLSAYYHSLWEGSWVRLLFGEFPATFLGTFSEQLRSHGGRNYIASFHMSYFYSFLYLQDCTRKDFHKTTGTLLDPGFKIWIWCIITMSLQCWFSVQSSITM